MGPKDFAHNLLVGGVAFVSVVAVLMLLLAYFGYRSEVMGGNVRRSLTTIAVLLVLMGAVAAVVLLFPERVRAAYDYVVALSYR